MGVFLLFLLLIEVKNIFLLLTNFFDECENKNGFKKKKKRNLTLGLPGFPFE